ncbi:hypothetical protein ACFTQ7_16520 [Lysinibacillus sp. NPDC056959]|uniref:hypothetical protein n=1 Tax=Lysinibacillus sp. NPDC056959 TaxID=3345981 RepID=UPI00363C0902
MMYAFIVSPIANAQESPFTTEEQRIEEVEEQLKFIWEEASIKDGSGKIIGIDLEKIENKYGPSTVEDQKAVEDIIDFNLSKGGALNEGINNKDQSGIIVAYNVAVDRCVNSKVADYFGAFLAPSAWTLLYQMLNEGKYKDAAKHLINFGVKGNVFVIAGSLTSILWHCLNNQEDWQ